MTIPRDDLPTLNDKLSWNKELDSLCNRILACRPPHVFGVHGDWGTGKTSFMRQLQWRLGANFAIDDSSIGRDPPFETEDCRKQRKHRKDLIATVWFEAWRYQGEPAPVVALLHEMRRQLAVVPAFQAKLKKLGMVTGRYLLGALGEAADKIGLECTIDPRRIQETGEKWEAEHYSVELATDSIRSLLTQTIKTLLPNKDGARVVVFIDDLDRCNPEAAFRLLEGLKIYLHVPNCVFVLGMNEQTLVDALTTKLPSAKDTASSTLQLRAAHYLEKICTDISRLPPPPDPPQHLGGWLANAEQREALILMTANLQCLPPNPRRLKALANQWWRFERRVPWPADGANQEIWATRVLVAAYIYQFHRDLWERWRFQPGFWKELIAWCCGEQRWQTGAMTIGYASDGTQVPTPVPPADWVGSLKLPERRSIQGDNDNFWSSSYPDPNAIEIFWIAPLIRAKRDYLAEQDFLPLLKSDYA